eukprot:471964-Amphidinium_carterae.1
MNPDLWICCLGQMVPQMVPRLEQMRGERYLLPDLALKTDNAETKVEILAERTIRIEFQPMRVCADRFSEPGCTGCCPSAVPPPLLPLTDGTPSACNDLIS